MLSIVARSLAAVSFGRCTVSRYYVFAQPIEKLVPKAAGNRSSRLQFRLIDPREPLAARLPRPPDEVAERFAEGSECFAAVAGNDLVGFIWLHYGSYLDREVRTRFVLPATASWDFDVFVAPAHRGGMTFFRLWEAAARHLAARGVRWSLSRVWSHNDDSLSSHARLGAYPIASVWCISAGKVWIRFADRAPRFLFSAGRAATVDLAGPDAACAYTRFAA